MLNLFFWSYIYFKLACKLFLVFIILLIISMSVVFADNRPGYDCGKFSILKTTRTNAPISNIIN